MEGRMSFRDVDEPAEYNEPSENEGESPIPVMPRHPVAAVASVPDSAPDPDAKQPELQDYVDINESGYFYIIQPSDTRAGVYKIGMTKRLPNERLCEYPKYSIPKYFICVANASQFEDLVMRKLGAVAKRCREYGLEYYEIDLQLLISLVHELWMIHGMSKMSGEEKTDTKRKPKGWQNFVNEWLAEHIGADVQLAYVAYCDSLKVFCEEPDDFKIFSTYYLSVI